MADFTARRVRPKDTRIMKPGQERLVLYSEEIRWGDIRDTAKRLFLPDGSGSGLHWAEFAWEAVAKTGYTLFDGELVRHRVIARFVAMASMFNDFVDVAKGGGVDVPESLDTGLLKVSMFRLGQLLPETLEDEVDDYCLVLEALRRLSDRQRPRVFDALLRTFGDEEGVFLSLWRSLTPGADFSKFPQERTALLECYAALETLQKKRLNEAYEFVKAGMPGSP